jgi:hypothetical protein
MQFLADPSGRQTGRHALGKGEDGVTRSISL